MEIWKDVVGYEGLYEVSNEGRVKSKQRIVTTSVGTKRKIEECILKPLNSKVKRYYHVSLYKNGKQKLHSVHRIVSIAFIDNPGSKKEVNHIDGDVSNNKVNNLEWVTRSENALHAYKTGLQKPNFKKSLEIAAERRRRKVAKLDYDGNLIESYNSITEAKKSIKQGAGNISAVLSGKRQKAGGFKWIYIDQKENK